MDWLLLRKEINYALLAVSLALLISGFGITEPGTVGPLSGGLLDKSFSFRIHSLLWGPFLILLILHIALPALRREWLER
jgi:hypothetical protein